MDEDRDESLVRISGNVRASRRGVLGGLGGVGAALGLTSSTSAIVGPGAAEAAAAPASSPAPIAEIAAASSRATSASTASSIVGYSNLHDPRVFNGLATPDRTNRSLDGLIPAGEAPPDVEVARAAAALEACDTPMQKYRQLVSLQNTDETTFYALLELKTAELLPVLYTPTVGDACLQFGTLTQRPPGLYVSLENLGNVRALVDNWPANDVRIAVLTDGERILGLGDQGVNGMGISAGKSMVYAACGIKPGWLLPVQVDNGTNNTKLLKDPLYVGSRRERVRGEAYDRLLDETVRAIQGRYGARTVIHWEDFAPRNAFRNLQRFRAKGAITYNDDIQGTAAVTVAGILASLRVTKRALGEQRVLFFGAGQANIGAAELLVRALVEDGVDESVARSNVFLFDSKGLVVDGRPAEYKISDDKIPFATKPGTPFTSSLEEAVKSVRPTALVGAAAQPQVFTKKVIESMCAFNPRPVIFALSNPTSKAECTATQAYEWSKGKAVFASGTLFAPVNYKGTRFAPGFANNAFIFPGVALGSLASGASSVTDAMFLAAARSLASQVSEENLAVGAVYPPTSTIREAAVVVGAAVAAAAVEEGVAAPGACRGGAIPGRDGRSVAVPSLDALTGGGNVGDETCANWEACVRDYLKTCL